ncbi:MAG TPA: hypothetical protein VGQ28_01315 [Thermoanaerobaculia bacterium]|nr:hypothetical protein [Thermoanaerobaculia bacterium]
MSSYTRHLAVVSLPLLLLLAAGCAHSGASPATSPKASLDIVAAARSVVLCKTTETELRRLLGAPTRDGILHKAHIMSWILRSETPVGYLAVLLDERGVVVDLYWDIPTEIPWVPADQCGGRAGG